jgi:hypothetical protein
LGDVDVCRDHPDADAVARCTGCNAPVCDACAAFLVDALPACRPCAWRAARAGRPRWDMAGACLLAGAGAEWAIVTAKRALDWSWAFVGFTGLVLLATAGHFLFPRGKKRVVAPRPMGASDLVEVEAGDGPYRRAKVMVPAPRVAGFSGRLAATFLFGSFVATALALPVSLSLPRWIEIEIVLGAWGLLLAGVLATFLFRGLRVDDDHKLTLDLGRREGVGNSGGAGGSRWTRWNPFEILSGATDPEGCAVGLVVVILVVVVLAAAFLVVELVVPVAFFLAYWVIVRAVRRVMRDRHDCKRNLARSLGWASLWTAVYFGPFAGLVALAHLIVRARSH